MNAETQPAATLDERRVERIILATDLSSHLQEAAEAAALAVDGFRALCRDSEPNDMAFDGLRHSVKATADIAERVVALLENRPTRWICGATEEEKTAIDRESVR